MAWNNLTDRQKQLDRKIEGSGVKLDTSSSCLLKVMRAIGASDNEADFVRQRIEIRLRTAAILNKTDAFIENTERVLDQFEKDEEEWKRRGKALGFNFWD